MSSDQHERQLAGFNGPGCLVEAGIHEGAAMPSAPRYPCGRNGQRRQPFVFDAQNLVLADEHAPADVRRHDRAEPNMLLKGPQVDAPIAVRLP
jgi:hypothetical protein